MKKLLAVLIVIGIALAGTESAKGAPFLYPPDGPLPVYDPKYHIDSQTWAWFYSQWVTSFPYPQNIM